MTATASKTTVYFTRTDRDGRQEVFASADPGDDTALAAACERLLGYYATRLRPGRDYYSLIERGAAIKRFALAAYEAVGRILAELDGADVERPYLREVLTDDEGQPVVTFRIVAETREASQ